jgi:hypothetical protein
VTPDPALVATNQHWRRLAIALALATPLAVALVSEFPLCPSAGVLGLPCPGCGLTRATLLLLHGDVARALALHPLVIPLAPIYLGALGALLLELVRGPTATVRTLPWVARRWVSILGGAVLLASVALWGARFLGYFGGPVPVQSYRSWAQAHAGPSLTR